MGGKGCPLLPLLARIYDDCMNLGFPEMIFIFLIALLIFGPKKLPEVGRQIGRFMNEFKRASNEFRSQIETEINNLDVEPRQTILAPISAPIGAVASGELTQPGTVDHAATPAVEHFQAVQADPPTQPVLLDASGSPVTLETNANGAAPAEADPAPIAESPQAENAHNRADEPKSLAEAQPSPPVKGADA